MYNYIMHIFIPPFFYKKKSVAYQSSSDQQSKLQRARDYTLYTIKHRTMKKLAIVLLISVFIINCTVFADAQTRGLQLIYQWSQMDFNFPTPRERERAIANGNFIPVNTSAPAGIEVAGSRVFITLPRWKNGVPSTLNTVPFPSDTMSPQLTPYPNLEFNRQGNCNGLTSVYRVKADECNRLWVLDTGTISAFSNAQNICPFKVVTFDLSNDQVINTFTFPTPVLRDISQLVTIEVEYPKGECGSPKDAVLYIADTVAFSLIVVDLSSNNAWRVRDKTMYANPDAGTFNVAGETFELMDGVLGLALSPRNLIPNEDRLLFYYAMSSFNTRWVPTRILRNQSLATTSPNEFQTAENERTSQAGDCAMDQNGVLFFGLLGEQAVACWNARLPLAPNSAATLLQNDQLLQFPVSVQVDNDSRLWVFATKFQSFFLGTLPVEGNNFNVFMATSTSDLVRGTACEQRTTQTAAKKRKNPYFNHSH